MHALYTIVAGSGLDPFRNITTTPQFGNSSISAVIEWTPEEGVIYEAIAVPEPAQSLTFLTRSQIQVILFYNTQYNITVAAIRCSQNSGRLTTTVSLSYGEDLSYYS